MLYFKTKLVLVYLIVCGLIACSNNHNRKMMSATKNMPDTEAKVILKRTQLFLQTLSCHQKQLRMCLTLQELIFIVFLMFTFLLVE